MELPLFQRYPGLVLPRLELGLFPSPVQDLGAGLFIKRDDLCGQDYGSNKVRKLELLLGDALARGRREVCTVGFAGSNHCVATALYARKAGLGCASFLMPQVPTRYGRANLLAGLACGAELRACGGPLALGPALALHYLRRLGRGVLPAFIPAGGTCPLGVAAYVNAALELKAQVDAGLLPVPDRIYVPMGSMGTAAGLVLGLAAAGLPTRVHAVRVIEPLWAPASGFRRLLRRTAAFLHRRDPAFPREVPETWVIRDGFLGAGYARFTPEGARAAEVLRRMAGISLNGAYTAKAFAALLEDAGKGELVGGTTLFWNTFNSRDLAALTGGADYRDLPAAFHPFFEGELQVLDP